MSTFDSNIRVILKNTSQSVKVCDNLVSVEISAPITSIHEHEFVKMQHIKTMYTTALLLYIMTVNLII